MLHVVHGLKTHTMTYMNFYKINHQYQQHSIKNSDHNVAMKKQSKVNMNGEKRK